MAGIHPKAVRNGYEPAPFFFVQKSDAGDTRLVAWAPSLAAVRRAFEGLIAVLGDSLEVLLKIKPDEPEDEGEPGEHTPDWVRYHGLVAQGALREAMAHCEAFVFQDGRNQLCVRDPDSLDYVVLDDDGVVFVYSSREVFRGVLTDAGFEERLEALVNAEPCWSQRPVEGPEQERDFIRLLRLSNVEGLGASDDPIVLH